MTRYPEFAGQSSSRPEPNWKQCLLAGDSWMSLSSQYYTSFVPPTGAVLNDQLATANQSLSQLAARSEEINGLLAQANSVMVLCVGAQDVLVGSQTIEQDLDALLAVLPMEVPKLHLSYQKWPEGNPFTGQLESLLYTLIRERVVPGSYEFLETWQFDEWGCTIVDGVHADPACYETRTEYSWVQWVRRYIDGRDNGNRVA